MYHEMKAIEIMEQHDLLPKKIKMRKYRKFMNNSVGFEKNDDFR
jgi:hypothetical protein